MYIHIFVCVCVYIYTYTYIYIQVYVYMCITYLCYIFHQLHSVIYLFYNCSLFACPAF